MKLVFDPLATDPEFYEHPAYDGLIVRHPARYSGSWTFRGTRVSPDAVLDNIAAGMPLDKVLNCFPSLRKQGVVNFLKRASPNITTNDEAA